jgi:hypothetical protein
MDIETTPEAIAAAVAQLRRSERGAQALSDFRKLLENGGDGLDSENSKALATLAAACHFGGCAGAYAIRCYLQPKKKT